MDDRAFGILLAKDRGFLIAFSRRKFNLSPDGAEDFVQTALLKAWEVRAHYVDDGKMRSWLITILCNLILSDKRRAWRISFHDDMTLMDRGTPAPQESAVYLNQVLTVMLKLPLPYLDSIMQAARGHSIDDASENIGIVKGTQKSRLSRGRKALQDLLE